jgi:NAD(P)-dependent dehydrogenase (short-subunit alcohol dehydrogenase family)
MFLVGQAVAKEMRRTGGGAIVNTASIAALVADGLAPAAHYNAAKAGVLNLTKQMAAELAQYGIRVNCVCPGLIETPMLRREDLGGDYVSTWVPLKRMGRAEEVAAVIAFLAGEDASYITGEAMVVDGGFTLT